ncbi:D-sedoheptulose 7-phosphate isomerase [Methylacidimicrobium cyclopophantes]|uniref:D-sedoheptulose 7-phosphate isomerase n=1 Tax=Methylacidimicrobium cyclopophantes TaxID=1041766 RepID=A0A5E6ME37_9BACT|nr:SIS domain-containing protein [Methylacidimicrobium cyclopophantes]VVM06521.1 D-sedoheptulose 7-phosphate isomerase [Methylacidimicrobium cyclopophantes]
MKEIESIVHASARELAETLRAAQETFSILERAASLCVECLREGKTIFTAGNGGSAADALHLAEELVGRYRSDRDPLPAVSLCADPTTLTCIANDFGFPEVFSRQLAALSRPGDLFVCFSTSGASANILSALRLAKSRAVRSVAFLGRDGGPAVQAADLAWIVPSQSTARIQELHTWGLHVILECVERTAGKQTSFGS